MGMKIAEIISSLEKLAPRVYQEAYDNSGLICGNPDAGINKVLCTLDCTEAVIHEAVARGCGMVVAHHPIVFSGLKSLTGKTYVERTVMEAIRQDVAIYAIHTNLDKAWMGVNRKMGEKLGLQNLETLHPEQDVLRKIYTYVPQNDLDRVREAMFKAGAGHIGEYDQCSFNTPGTGTFRGSSDSKPSVGKAGESTSEEEIRVEMIFPVHLQQQIVEALISSHPYEEVAYDLVKLENDHQRIGSGMIGSLPSPLDEKGLLALVGRVFKCEVIRHTALLGRQIERVAICGGAGRFLLNDAIRRGADVFITADIKYHEFFDAEHKLLMMDIGHHESEQFTPELLKEYIEEKFPTFAVLLSEAITNPVHYYIS